MSITENDREDIIRRLREDVRNPRQIHPLDEKRVEKIFCDIVEQNRQYTLDDLDRIVNNLGDEFSKTTRNIIIELACYKKILHIKKMYEAK